MSIEAQFLIITVLFIIGLVVMIIMLDGSFFQKLRNAKWREKDDIDDFDYL